MKTPTGSGNMSSAEEVPVDLGSESVKKLDCARHAFEEKVKSEEILVGPYESKTRLVRLINGGAFGQICLGKNLSDGQEVAVKIEHPGPGLEQLLYEGQVYRKLEGGQGIPQVFWYGMHGSNFNVMVMELLGKSLQELFFSCDKNFSLKTVLMLLDQMIDTIGFIHRKNFVHRDISTNNFMMGAGPNSHKLYLVDYGLAKTFRVGPTFSQGRFRTNAFNFRVSRPMVGTARFCSTFCHRGEEESRRDDLESICYVCFYLLRGSLPWQGLHGSHMTSKLDKIYEHKRSISVETLCEGLPEEFAVLLNFVRGMKQFDTPDYNAIKKLFQDLAAKEGIEYDNCYDWVVPTINPTYEIQEKLLNMCNLGPDSNSAPSDEPISH